MSKENTETQSKKDATPPMLKLEQINDQLENESIEQVDLKKEKEGPTDGKDETDAAGGADVGGAAAADAPASVISD